MQVNLSKEELMVVDPETGGIYLTLMWKDVETVDVMWDDNGPLQALFLRQEQLGVLGKLIAYCLSGKIKITAESKQALEEMQPQVAHLLAFWEENPLDEAS